MLINCLSCGKTVSNRKDFCPYCTHEIPLHIQEMERGRGVLKKSLLNQTYKGTILSLVKK
ncbi:MAG: hypothetical protein ACD_51C00299G0003 [uncultured bacterium]|nr:MAG: hypothetical protein ACD_51C00299G0003 [uncultured bacterium]